MLLGISLTLITEFILFLLFALYYKKIGMKEDIKTYEEIIEKYNKGIKTHEEAKANNDASWEKAKKMWEETDAKLEEAKEFYKERNKETCRTNAQLDQILAKLKRANHDDTPENL